MNAYTQINNEDLEWRVSNLMKIPNADFLERTGSHQLGARIWLLPAKSAMTLHRHYRKEEFYFLLKGIGRIRVGEDVLTVNCYNGVHVAPEVMRQVFNDTEREALWLIVGAPEHELVPGMEGDPTIFYPEDPCKLPEEMLGMQWPPINQSS